MLFHIAHSKLVRDGVGIIWKRPYTTFCKRSVIHLLVHLLLNVVVSRVLWHPVSCNHTHFSLIGIVRLMTGFSLKPFPNSVVVNMLWTSSMLQERKPSHHPFALSAQVPLSNLKQILFLYLLLIVVFFIPDVHISSQTLQDSEFSLIGDIQSVCLFLFHVALLGESIQLLGPVGSPSPATLLESLLPPYIAVL